jgi:hypothetical protein
MQSQKKSKVLQVVLLAVITVLVFAASPGQAQGNNILLNTNFSQNSGNSVPVSWTFFAPPSVTAHDYWIGGPPTGGFFAQPLSGTQYWKEWNAGYYQAPTNNVAGIYQTFGASPGAIYQATGWFYTSSSDQLGADNTAWVDVSFLNASGIVIALYTSAPFNAAVGEDGWFQYNVTNVCNLSAPIATGDPYFTNYVITGAVTQLVAPAGTTQVRYRMALLAVNTEGGSIYFDDPALLQQAGLSAPIISNMVPVNMIFYPTTNGLSFNAISPSGTTISNSGIQVVLNGSNVSSALTITGSTSNKTVVFKGLQSNTIYNASITVTDASGLSASVSNYFETTWVGIPPVIYLWEAEDYDFSGGKYIDYPDLCIVAGDPNCYFGQAGVYGVDYYEDGENGPHLYRQDFMNTDVSGDYLRDNLYIAGRTDYEINPFEQNEWVNYTRDFTNGTYWIIARLATDIGLSGTLTMSKLNSDGSSNIIGTFTISHGLGWTTFENIFLVDSNGNKASIALNGKETLQVTSGGNLLPNFYALVQATVDQPVLSGMYPTGTHPFEYTNALSFTVTTVGATFPVSGLNVTLDGFNVTSNLVITGSATAETITYPKLLLNASHTAIISVTNSLGHGLLVTNKFDTFSTNNYMWEASDFDYNGGQYITANNWYPNAYQGLRAVTNIDFQHTTISGESYPYRSPGIPQEQGKDYLTPAFVNYGGIEYDLGDFGGGDWANYTGMYPQGKFFVYARTAGLGSNSMYLEKVVSGAGTTNQVVKKLGDWNSVGINNTTYYWVALTDDGSVAPVAVTFGGLETLRVTTTTGDVYPNYFMLVAAGGVNVSATRQGANATISFPTQAGVVYRVLSQNTLGGQWNLVTSVLGTGGVQSVSVAAGSGVQFFEVTAP